MKTAEHGPISFTYTIMLIGILSPHTFFISSLYRGTQLEIGHCSLFDKHIALPVRLLGQLISMLNADYTLKLVSEELFP